MTDVDLLRFWLSYRLWEKCRSGIDPHPMTQKELVQSTVTTRGGRPTVSEPTISKFVRERGKGIAQESWTAVAEILGCVTLEDLIARAREWASSKPAKDWMDKLEPTLDRFPEPTENMLAAARELRRRGVRLGPSVLVSAQWVFATHGDQSVEAWVKALKDIVRVQADPEVTSSRRPKARGKLADKTRHRKHSSVPPPRLDQPLPTPPPPPASRRTKKQR